MVRYDEFEAYLPTEKVFYESKANLLQKLKFSK